MNAKYLALLMIFGLFATLVQCRSFVERDDDSDDDSDGDNAVDTRATDDSDGSDDVDNNELREEKRGTDDSDSDEVDNDELREEKRAIHDYLQNQDEASEFLDQSRRLFSSSAKDHMKEAKKKYEEKCERLLHPRYCPDLNTWPAWNQAWNAAGGKK